ncbi:carbon starvation CstA family protein [Gudongella oleilytica]|uniref:carbon starvation CstA family protein n=1 Tax=Gudongella oleilytica TaxID=1582259 RepID=UPI002A368284|nr:carbon starvation CstA 5TM domain-containing protein [Gudongella oleilytica]
MTTITECQLALNEKQTLLQTSHFHVLLFEISVELFQGSISTQFLGPAGGVLAMLGVIASPITSGDTAFRSARRTIADAINFEQGPIAKRLILSVPLFIIGFALTKIDFNNIWRYFKWSNQTLAMIVLWASAAYLVKQGKSHWMASLPATFMTAASITYIMQASEGFKLASSIAYPVGAIAAFAAMLFFINKTRVQVATAE